MKRWILPFLWEVTLRLGRYGTFTFLGYMLANDLLWNLGF